MNFYISENRHQIPIDSVTQKCKCIPRSVVTSAQPAQNRDRDYSYARLGFSIPRPQNAVHRRRFSALRDEPTANRCSWKLNGVSFASDKTAWLSRSWDDQNDKCFFWQPHALPFISDATAGPTALSPFADR